MEALLQFINQITGYNKIRDALKAFLGVVPIAASVQLAVGTESGTVINVTGQVVDVAGNALREDTNLLFYLSNDAAGQALITTAHDSGFAIGTDGTIIVEFTANKCGWLITEADGDFDIDFDESGALTAYLQISLPSGRRVASVAITHA